jgi:putative colanic acid biosynthesis acetyltransferase WcaF
MKASRQYTTHPQSSAYESPWTFGMRLRLQAWEWCWTLFCRWTPKPLNSWRLCWLRLFGAKITGQPFVHSRARIAHPWNLTMRDRACLGDGAHAYTLGPIELGEACTIAQEAYLCSATHDLSVPERPLLTAPIVIQANAFVGLRAIVLPGVTVGEGAIVGAGAVVTRDVAPGSVVAGNPARPLASPNAASGQPASSS